MLLFLVESLAGRYRSRFSINSETGTGVVIEVQSWVDKYRTGSGSDRVEHSTVTWSCDFSYSVTFTLTP